MNIHMHTNTGGGVFIHEDWIHLQKIYTTADHQIKPKVGLRKLRISHVHPYMESRGQAKYSKI